VEAESKSKKDVVRVTAEPGICGFSCKVEARRTGRQNVLIEIKGSECEQAQRLSSLLEKMSMRDLFAPVTRNPVFLAAEGAGCHPSCPIPVAILKAAEVAMNMALPKEVLIKFKP
jgi:hypothetical protein